MYAGVVMTVFISFLSIFVGGLVSSSPPSAFKTAFANSSFSVFADEYNYNTGSSNASQSSLYENITTTTNTMKEGVSTQGGLASGSTEYDFISQAWTVIKSTITMPELLIKFTTNGLGALDTATSNVFSTLIEIIIGTLGAGLFIYIVFELFKVALGRDV
jgi:hypothetical protein